VECRGGVNRKKKENRERKNHRGGSLGPVYLREERGGDEKGGDFALEYL